jgi:hypothetical protein
MALKPGDEYHISHFDGGSRLAEDRVVKNSNCQVLCLIIINGQHLLSLQISFSLSDICFPSKRTIDGHLKTWFR